jgi:hypothetical protein
LDTSVTWSISPANVGSFAAGLYTAPGTISSTQTITITATSHADPTRQATATVVLQPSAPAPSGVSISVTPGSVSLKKSQVQGFYPKVTGTTDTTVIWSISPAVGSIGRNGVYVAPKIITSTQTVTVTATSHADPSKTATATVTLRP